MCRKNGVSKQIREFVVPLCATIHLSGSMISITGFTTAVLMMNGMPHGIGVLFPYIAMLGIAMVAAPGAPGGAIMSALPFLPMVWNTIRWWTCKFNDSFILNTR